MAAGDGEPMRHDLPGTEYSRMATDAQVVGQHSSATDANGRQRSCRLGNVWVARRPVHHFCQEVVQGIHCLNVKYSTHGTYIEYDILNFSMHNSTSTQNVERERERERERKNYKF